jgi:serine/threonine-protein kinase RsbW
MSGPENDDVEPACLRLAATAANVPRISDFVREAGQRLRLTEEVRFDIDLAVEEASTNIVRHAYGPDRAGDIEVRVEAAVDAVRITFTDWGLPFEADPSHLAVDVPLEQRAQGGMGLLLVDRLMDEVARETAPTPGGPNVLILVKNIEH